MEPAEKNCFDDMRDKKGIFRKGTSVEEGRKGNLNKIERV